MNNRDFELDPKSPVAAVIFLKEKLRLNPIKIIPTYNGYRFQHPILRYRKTQGMLEDIFHEEFSSKLAETISQSSDIQYELQEANQRRRTRVLETFDIEWIVMKALKDPEGWFFQHAGEVTSSYSYPARTTL